MNVLNPAKPDILGRAVELAIEKLVRVTHHRGESFAHLPIFYPSGAAAAISVTVEHNGFRVSDAGYAYQEVAMIGAEYLFPRRAMKIAEKYGIDLDGHALTAFTPADRLTGAICNIAAASAETAHEIISRADNGGENDMASHVFEKLMNLFGDDKVAVAPELKGASGRAWNITALVATPHGTTAFKAVGTHAMSTCYAATALRDIALLSSAPRVVAVVRSIEAMGELYHILAQAGDVIEETASDEAFRRAVGG